MAKFTVIQGHPDPSGKRLNHALADRYAGAAIAAGHEVRVIDVARLDFPLLRAPEDFYDAQAPEPILAAQRDIAWADHLAIFYPLWLGDMPAILKGFLEQTFRPGFALEYSGARRFPRKLLTGKTARIITTMGMPAFIYRSMFGAHSLKSLVLNLRMCGITPARETLIGNVGDASAVRLRKWLDRIAILAKRDGIPEQPARRKPVRTLVRIGVLGGMAYGAYAALAWTRFGKVKGGDALLDGAMPEYDVRLHHEVSVHAPAALTFDAMQHTDFERSPIVQALFRARELFLGAQHVSREMPRGLLAQLEALGWTIVAQEPGRELVFGALTQPWHANPAFRGVPAEEFAQFKQPGYAKIAFTLRVDPVDEKSSIARTETRVQTTDQESWSKFRRYWSLLSPGIELIRLVLLQQIKSEAEARHKRAETRPAEGGILAP